MKQFLKKIDSLLSKRNALIILSVFIAVIAWFVVNESKNPVIEKTVTVNIAFTNSEIPEGNNLVFATTQGAFLNSCEVTISGRTSIINNVTPEDLIAEVDLSNIKNPGEYNLTIKVESCEKLGVSIKDYYPKQITVNYIYDIDN